MHLRTFVKTLLRGCRALAHSVITGILIASMILAPLGASCRADIEYKVDLSRMYHGFAIGDETTYWGTTYGVGINSQSVVADGLNSYLSLSVDENAWALDPANVTTPYLHDTSTGETIPINTNDFRGGSWKNSAEELHRDVIIPEERLGHSLMAKVGNTYSYLAPPNGYYTGQGWFYFATIPSDASIVDLTTGEIGPGTWDTIRSVPSRSCHDYSR
jgi:hypothetical protein